MTNPTYRDRDGYLHLGTAESSVCRNCGAGGIPVLSKTGNVVWWRVPQDCCDAQRRRFRKALAAGRLPYKDPA